MRSERRRRAAARHDAGRPLTGGGFGDATITPVRRDRLDSFCEAMSRQYKDRLGIDMTPLVCQIVDGAE